MAKKKEEKKKKTRGGLTQIEIMRSKHDKDSPHMKQIEMGKKKKKK